MGARTGQEYLAGLKDDRTVWLDGRRVDVVDEPRFAGSLQGMAEYFDYQHEHADDCLVEDAETGELINASHIIPRCDDDLRRRHRALDRLARYSVGMLGRTPDYVNVTVAGFVAQRGLFEKNGDTRAGAALAAFQRDVALPRSVADPHHHQPGHRQGRRRRRGHQRRAVAAHRPTDRRRHRGQRIEDPRDARTVRRRELRLPGLCATQGRRSRLRVVLLRSGRSRVVCTRSAAITTRSKEPRADYPFSSRFDEQDAFLIFDEVEVPWERVFIAGDLDVYGSVMKHGWAANIIQQTAIRAAVKLEFAYDLAFKMVEVQNMGSRADATQLLGELVTYADMTRAAIRAAEADAHEYVHGGWFCDTEPFTAIKALMPSWMTRVNEIFKTLGGHNLLCTPNEAAFADPGARPVDPQVPARRQRHQRRGAGQDLPHGLGLRRLGARLARANCTNAST